MKKAQLSSTTLKLIAGVIAFAVIFFIFSKGTAHAPTAIYKGEFQSRAQGCIKMAGDEKDSDGDGKPDSCDPCVDVADDLKLTTGIARNTGIDNIKGVYDKLHTGTGYVYVDDEEDKSDNDNDLLHDACEMTKEMEWAKLHPIQARTTVIGDIKDDLEKIIDPKDSPDKIRCKYWFSEYQCCSRLGKVNPVDKDGNELKDNKLTRECLDHLDQPR